MKKKIAVLAVATALSAAALGTVAGAEESERADWCCNADTGSCRDGIRTART